MVKVFNSEISEIPNDLHVIDFKDINVLNKSYLNVRYVIPEI